MQEISFNLPLSTRKFNSDEGLASNEPFLFHEMATQTNVIETRTFILRRHPQCHGVGFALFKFKRKREVSYQMTMMMIDEWSEWVAAGGW